MVGLCQVTKSHHNHRGQKPTMVGFCHGGNVPISQEDEDDEVKSAFKGGGGSVHFPTFT